MQKGAAAAAADVEAMFVEVTLANSSSSSSMTWEVGGGQMHCVAGAVLTHDVTYTGFYFLNVHESALWKKIKVVLKLTASPFLSYATPQRGGISNIRKSQTKHV